MITWIIPSERFNWGSVKKVALTILGFDVRFSEEIVFKGGSGRGYVREGAAALRLGRAGARTQSRKCDSVERAHVQRRGRNDVILENRGDDLFENLFLVLVRHVDGGFEVF